MTTGDAVGALIIVVIIFVWLSGAFSDREPDFNWRGALPGGETADETGLIFAIILWVLFLFAYH